MLFLVFWLVPYLLLASLSYSCAVGTSTRWTSADLNALPDDGNRYEIIDGEPNSLTIIISEFAGIPPIAVSGYNNKVPARLRRKVRSGRCHPGLLGLDSKLYTRQQKKLNIFGEAG